MASANSGDGDNYDDDWEGASLYSGSDSGGVHSDAVLYARLHAKSMALQARLRDLSASLLNELKPYEAVDIGPSVVLAHIEKPATRRPITQKVLKEVGVSPVLLQKVLDATAPSLLRTGQLKVMVKTAYDALRPPSKRMKRDETSEE
jgi:hypothetical protein